MGRRRLVLAGDVHRQVRRPQGDRLAVDVEGQGLEHLGLRRENVQISGLLQLVVVLEGDGEGGPALVVDREALGDVGVAGVVLIDHGPALAPDANLAAGKGILVPGFFLHELHRRVLDFGAVKVDHAVVAVVQLLQRHAAEVVAGEAAVDFYIVGAAGHHVGGAGEGHGRLVLLVEALLPGPAHLVSGRPEGDLGVLGPGGFALRDVLLQGDGDFLVHLLADLLAVDLQLVHRVHIAGPGLGLEIGLEVLAQLLLVIPTDVVDRVSDPGVRDARDVPVREHRRDLAGVVRLIEPVRVGVDHGLHPGQVVLVVLIGRALGPVDVILVVHGLQMVVRPVLDLPAVPVLLGLPGPEQVLNFLVRGGLLAGVIGVIAHLDRADGHHGQLDRRGSGADADADGGVAHGGQGLRAGKAVLVGVVGHADAGADYADHRAGPAHAAHPAGGHGAALGIDGVEALSAEGAPAVEAAVQGLQDLAHRVLGPDVDRAVLEGLQDGVVGLLLELGQLGGAQGLGEGRPLAAALDLEDAELGQVVREDDHLVVLLVHDVGDGLPTLCVRIVPAGQEGVGVQMGLPFVIRNPNFGHAAQHAGLAVPLQDGGVHHGDGVGVLHGGPGPGNGHVSPSAGPGDVDDRRARVAVPARGDRLDIGRLRLRVVEGLGNVLQRPVQEGDDLAPGAGGVGAEGGRRGAVGDLRRVPHGPEHRLEVVLGGGHVRKGIADTGRRGLPQGAPQEGDHLAAGAALVRREGGGGGAVGDALLHRPQHGLVIILGAGNVIEGILAAFRLRLAHGPPQEGDHLAAGAGVRRGKVGAVHPVRDLGLVIHRPEHRLIIVLVLGHIYKSLRSKALHGEHAQQQHSAQRQADDPFPHLLHMLLPPLLSSDGRLNSVSPLFVSYHKNCKKPMPFSGVFLHGMTWKRGFMNSLSGNVFPFGKGLTKGI